MASKHDDVNTLCNFASVCATKNIDLIGVWCASEQNAADAPRRSVLACFTNLSEAPQFFLSIFVSRVIILLVGNEIIQCQMSKPIVDSLEFRWADEFAFKQPLTNLRFEKSDATIVRD